MENNMLKVQLDLSKGVYVISRNDGKEEIIKEINDGTTNRYSKDRMDRRRKEIEKIEGKNGWMVLELSRRIDPVLYDALEAFDAKYGTEYRHIYAKIASKEISYTEVGVSDLSKKREYEQKTSKIRAEELERAGISIKYNVNLFKAPKEIGFMDRIRILRTANEQKAVGAKVGERQGLSIIETIKDFRNTILQKINDARAEKIQRRLELNQKRLEESIPRDENGLVDDVPELSEEELRAINSGTLEQTGVTIDVSNSGIKDSVKTNPAIANPATVNPVSPEVSIPDPVTINLAASEVPIPESMAVKKSDSAVLEQTAGIVPKAKKNMSRSKSIKASKQAAREARKMKNSYEDRIKAKADAKKVAEEGRKKAAAKRAEDAQRAAQEEQERIARQREEQIKQKKAAEEAKLAAEEAAKALNDKKLTTRLSRKLKNIQESIKNKVHMPDFSEQKRKITGAVTIAVEKAKEMKKEAVIRFTRTLKDAQDSIKNKVHIPKVTGAQKKIAGALAAVALVGALGGVVTASTFTNANADNLKENVQPTTPVVETVESTRPELGEIDRLGYEEKVDNKQNMNVNVVEKQEQGTTNAQNTQEKSKEEQQKEYLSSIRVGCNMKIENGKYFASPDGTGNFGYFENYQDGVNRLTIIDVITNEGVIVVTDSNISLYDLKQQYPNAKFSYHFEFVHSNGRTTTLGWLTGNSMEQNIQMDHQIDEGR